MSAFSLKDLATRPDLALGRAPPQFKRLAKAVSPLADPIIARRYWRTTGDQTPIPPLRMRAGIGALRSAEFFVRSGKEVAERLTLRLEELGPPYSAYRHVLDYGCGCGRVMLHMAGRGPIVSGCDVARPSLAWLLKHASPGPLAVNANLPPLPWPDASFDLVYGISIFTHLDERKQDLWLTELRRIVIPGGLLLLTTNGEHMHDVYRRMRILPDELKQKIASHGPLEAAGIVFEPYRSAGVGGHKDLDPEYGLAFHSERYVRNRWGKALNVEGFWAADINLGQDLVALRRPGGEGAPAALSSAR